MCHHGVSVDTRVIQEGDISHNLGMNMSHIRFNVITSNF